MTRLAPQMPSAAKKISQPESCSEVAVPSLLQLTHFEPGQMYGSPRLRKTALNTCSQGLPMAYFGKAWY